MTLPVSSSASVQRPQQLDLGTLNSSHEVAVTAIQHIVCEWEQKAVDAGSSGDWRSAQQYKDWAFAANMVRTQVGSALGALFLESLQSLSVVTDQRTVELPNLSRTPQDQYLDAMALEVASHQDEPAA
jgi:hypothetical protein